MVGSVWFEGGLERLVDLGRERQGVLGRQCFGG